MAILLCCSDDAVLDRWKDLLGDGYEFAEAQTLSQLQKYCADGSFELVLLHRAMVDAASFAAIRQALAWTA